MDKLVAKSVLNSNGLLGAEVSVYCTFHGKSQAVAKTISNATIANDMAIQNDPDSFHGGSIEKCCEIVNSTLNQVVKGREISELLEMDEDLFNFDSKNGFRTVGANCIFTTSLALSLACAKLRKSPEYEHFGYMCNNHQVGGDL